MTQRTKSIKLPECSLAAGLDFGLSTRLNLTALTLSEQHMIAKNRHYHQIVRVSSNRLPGRRTDFSKSEIRGQSIIFRDDSAVISCLALLCASSDTNITDLKDVLSRSFTIELVGPEGEQENIYRNAREAKLLQCRPFAIYQRLAVLQYMHPQYQNDPKLILGDNPNLFQETFATFVHNVNTCHEQMFDSAIRTCDENVLNEDTINGDDVAGIRSGILQQVDLDETEDTSDNMKLSYSYMYQDAPGNDIDDEDLTQSYMKNAMNTIRKAFNVKLAESKDKTRNY